ncbi:MAG: hypothetical protein Q7S26_01860 [bacterium]|nr:hypothetical protein [bacterium]
MSAVKKKTYPSPRKKKLVRLAWLDPDAALNFGYALHAADDEGLKGTAEGRLANRQADKFNSLTAAEGTPDWEYLTQVETIVLSHARGITRRKKAQLEELRNAARQHMEALQNFRGSRSQSNLLNILYSKAGMNGLLMALLAGIGYFLAQTIGPFLLPYLPQSAHDGRAPSFLAALIFAGLGRFVSAKWTDFSQSRIERNYQRLYHRAKLTYEQGKLDEIQKHREWLCILWKQYMGEEYPEKPSYAVVIKADINTEIGLQEMQTESQQSDIRNAIEHSRAWLRRRWRGGEEHPPTTAEHPTSSGNIL